MQTPQCQLFTATEAAVLTRLSVKAVNNAIDKKAVSAVGGERDGNAARLLDRTALMSLALERRLADRFVPELRREIFAALVQESRSALSLEGGLVNIDLREPRRELAAALRGLRRARRLVVTDPEILGGDPVFRGTRVPVHLIAGLLAQGSTQAEVMEGYPRLTIEMLQAAPIYAAAYPLRGRPRAQPWTGQPPVKTSHRKLATIETV